MTVKPLGDRVVIKNCEAEIVKRRKPPNPA